MLKNFKCDLDDCERSFTWRRDLDRHKQSSRHIPKANVEQFRCIYCSKTCSRIDNLQKHHKVFHSLACLDCRQVFIGVVEHFCASNIHHGLAPLNMNSRYMCPFCHERYGQETKCAQHIEQIHAEETLLHNINPSPMDCLFLRIP
jgi:hypothetical protein